MVRTKEEMVAWLLTEKKKIEGHMCGLPRTGFWCGYYQGKLDLIDFQLRYYTDNWSEKFGGVTEIPKMKADHKHKGKCKLRHLIRKVFQVK